jgi:hypothetical protein
VSCGNSTFDSRDAVTLEHVFVSFCCPVIRLGPWGPERGGAVESPQLSLIVFSFFSHT